MEDFDLLDIEVLIRNESPFPLPDYKHPWDSGMDIQVITPNEEPVFLKRGDAPTLFHTGLYVSIPRGFEMQVRARSSIGALGIIVPQGVGTIDSGYTGEIKVCLANITDTMFQVTHGQRVAQLVLTRVERCYWKRTRKLLPSSRNSGGFGSTGL